MSEKKKLRIMVLSGTSQYKLVETAKKRGYYVEVINPTDLLLFLSDRINYDELWNTNSERIFANSWDAIIPRIGRNREFASVILEQLRRNLGIWSLQSGPALSRASNKIRTLQICSREKIRVPKTIFGFSPKNLEFIAKKIGGVPFILKNVYGSQGKGVLLMDSERSANAVMGMFYNEQRAFINQEFIDNSSEKLNASDLRLIVVDGQVVSCMKRIAKEKEYRANLSLSGSAIKYEPSEETKEMAVKAAQAIGLSNFCGVDIMEKEFVNSDGKTEITRYLIEINGNPGERVIAVTGINHWENVLDLVEKDYRKPQGDLATTDAPIIKSDEQILLEKLNATQDINERLKILKAYGW